MPRTKLHAIMISLPYQGHINPFVSLALKIASKGISVTFVHLHYIHLRLTGSAAADPFSDARQSGLDISYTTISDGFPFEYDRDVHALEHWDSICNDTNGVMDEFVRNTIQSTHPDFINFLVLDTVYAWTTNVATKYNLINVSFWTEPALVFTLGFHWDLLKEKGYVPYKGIFGLSDEVNCIPGIIQSLNTRDFMSYLTAADDTIIPEILYTAFQNAKKADFLLHNTVEELESETLSFLNAHQPNYAIGPIGFSKTIPTSTVTRSLLSECDCTHWLESKPCGSVLYVSFGSVVHTTKEVVQEMAYGLLLSEVNFIWVVRTGIVGSVVDLDNVLPEGFEGKIGNKGLIIPWCNQIEILSNPAVGGFLTHNGWNSTVESMWCGVPMLCYPVAYDQPTNRKLVVEEWRVGIDLCDEGAEMDREAVAQRIKSFMKEKRLQGEAKRVKETLHNAMEIEGSSERNFGKFIKDLEDKIIPSIIV